MASQRWSVQLALTDAVATRLSRGDLSLAWRLNERVYEVEIGEPSGGRLRSEDQERAWHRSDPDEDVASSFTIEFEAADARDARIRAQHTLGEMQRCVGLPVEASPVVWVAPVAATSTSGRRFWSLATNLIDEEEFAAAVVCAQIHVEVQVRAILEAAIHADGTALAEAVGRREASWSLLNRWHQDILEALLGLKVTTFPRWKEYVVHVQRRNAIVHRGIAIEEAEARLSLELADAMWTWLNRESAIATARI